MRFNFLLHLILWTPFVTLLANNIGIPPIQNFSKKTYHAGTQNWDIEQDEKGVLFFANNEGLLSFDGTHWERFPLPNQTIMRSIEIAKDGKIYVGGQGEIGYFAPNETGVLHFSSLMPLISEPNKNFADVWSIEETSEGIFFQTSNQVLRYSDGQISVVFKDAFISYMGQWQDEIIIYADLNRLLIYENGIFELLKTQGLSSYQIASILPFDKETVLITTLKNGIFSLKNGQFQKWVTSNDDFLKERRVYKSILLSNQQIALATSTGGLVILDQQGRATTHLNKSLGLQNSNILSVFEDKNSNLWLGLDNGIDYVQINSPLSYIYPDGKQEGPGYAIQHFQNRFYFGTSNGLYSTSSESYHSPFATSTFEEILNSSGQVWGLSNIQDELFLSHHEGIFQIKENVANPLAPIPNGWTFVELNETTMLVGYYNGLAIYKKTETGWVFQKTLEDFKESARIMVKDDQGSVWVSHPYRGIYKIELNEKGEKLSIDFYNKKHGLPTDNFNYVFLINGQAIFAAERGVFQYDRESNRFFPYKLYNDEFGEENRVQCLQEDLEGNVWFVVNDKVGVLLIEDNVLKKNVKTEYIPELTGNLVAGFETIYPIDKDVIFFGAEQGFIQLDLPKYLAQDTALELVFHEVVLIDEKDSLLLGSFGTIMKEIPSFLPSQNSFRFSFSATDYRNLELIEYHTFLEGFDNQSTSWHHKKEVEYPNLPPGSYTFHVKARNQKGIESLPLTFSFKIQPPWYASVWAYMFYTLLVLGAILGLMFFQKKKFETEKAELKSAHLEKEVQHQEEVKEKETALHQLQNEKMLAEIDLKTRSLASTTMHLVQRGEILSKIQSELQKVAKMKNPSDMQNEIEKIVKLIAANDFVDEHWAQFAQYFDEVHNDLLKKLREDYPKLSPNDFKLCAYLRMNLSTKEIATLMNISVRGVEASRYRLRKKLGLAGEVNLVEFMMGV